MQDLEVPVPTWCNRLSLDLPKSNGECATLSIHDHNHEQTETRGFVPLSFGVMSQLT